MEDPGQIVLGLSMPEETVQTTCRGLNSDWQYVTRWCRMGIGVYGRRRKKVGVRRYFVWIFPSFIILNMNVRFRTFTGF
jgi:hypothetical protein